MSDINEIKRSVTVNAPKSTVWAILDDFANIQDWSSVVKTSVQVGDAATGLGAERACEFAPFGSTDEKIIGYEPEESMTIELTNIKKLPIKRSVTTFTLQAIDDHTTEVTMTPRPEAKGGIASGLVAKRLAKSLPKGIEDLLAELKTAAEERVAKAA